MYNAKPWPLPWKPVDFHGSPWKDARKTTEVPRSLPRTSTKSQITCTCGLGSADVRRSGTRQRLRPWQGRSCRATRDRLKWSNRTKLSELTAVLFSVEGSVTSYNSPHSACQGWQMLMQEHRLRARHSFGYRTAAYSRLPCV